MYRNFLRKKNEYINMRTKYDTDPVNNHTSVSCDTFAKCVSTDLYSKYCVFIQKYGTTLIPNLKDRLNSNLIEPHEVTAFGVPSSWLEFAIKSKWKALPTCGKNG